MCVYYIYNYIMICLRNMALENRKYVLLLRESNPSSLVMQPIVESLYY